MKLVEMGANRHDFGALAGRGCLRQQVNRDRGRLLHAPAGRRGCEEQGLALLGRSSGQLLWLLSISSCGSGSAAESRGEGSKDAVRMPRLSEENTALKNEPAEWACPLRVPSRLPSVSHSRAVLSQDAVRMRPPSGERRARGRLGMAFEGGERLAVGVPQPRRVVSGRGEDAGAVRGEYRARDPPSWPLRVATPYRRRPIAAPCRPKTRSGCGGRRGKIRAVDPRYGL